MSPASLAVQSQPVAAPAPNRHGAGPGHGGKAGDDDAAGFGAMVDAADEPAPARGARRAKGEDGAGDCACEGAEAALDSPWTVRRTDPHIGATADNDDVPEPERPDADATAPADALAVLLDAVTAPKQAETVPAKDAAAGDDPAPAAAIAVDAEAKDMAGDAPARAATPAVAAAAAAASAVAFGAVPVERPQRQGNVEARPAAAATSRNATEAAAPAPARNAAANAAEAPAEVATPRATAPETRPEASGSGSVSGAPRRDGRSAEGRNSGSVTDAKVSVISVQVAPAPAAAPVAPSPTGAALVASLDADGTLARYASDTASAPLPGAEGKPVTNLKLQLHPAELGNVTVTIAGRGDDLAIDIKVENNEARSRLTNDSEAIVRSLRALGYDVDRLTVQQVPQSTAAGQQQTATGGRGDGFAAFEQRGGERGQGQQNQANGNARDNGPHDTAHHLQQPRGGAGGVYI